MVPKSMAMSGLVCRKAVVGARRAISVKQANKPSYLVGPPFPSFMARFSAAAVWWSDLHVQCH